MKAILTKHAQNRLKQRMGVHKSSAKHIADMALQNGVSHEDTSRALKKYISNLYLSKRNANNIKVYKGFAFLFAGNKLLTVIKLPEKLTQGDKEIDTKTIHARKCQESKRSL